MTIVPVCDITTFFHLPPFGVTRDILIFDPISNNGLMSGRHFVALRIAMRRIRWKAGFLIDRVYYVTHHAIIQAASRK